MKIPIDRQQPAAAQQAVEKKAKPQGRDEQEKTAAKRPRKGDTVALSGSLDAELTARQAEQAKRVASIKALVKGGDYQIDSREVAKKILSRSSGR